MTPSGSSLVVQKRKVSCGSQISVRGLLGELQSVPALDASPTHVCLPRSAQIPRPQVVGCSPERESNTMGASTFPAQGSGAHDAGDGPAFQTQRALGGTGPAVRRVRMGLLLPLPTGPGPAALPCEGA